MNVNTFLCGATAEAHAAYGEIFPRPDGFPGEGVLGKVPELDVCHQPEDALSFLALPRSTSFKRETLPARPLHE